MSPARLIVTAAVFALTAQTAQAQIFGQPRTNAQRTQDRQIAQIPRCEQPLGTLTIADGDAGDYDAMQLQPPQNLLRVVVQRSGCFTLVDRGSPALEAIERERRLASSGALQRNSNMGEGQIRAADFILLAQVASENDNASGAGVRGSTNTNNGPSAASRVGGLLKGAAGVGMIAAGGGFAPSMFNGRIGGGVDTRTGEANTVLSIVNVRTTETMVVSQGYAAKRDVNWSLTGSAAFGGFVGGGYENTEIGRIVAQSFINAYADVVGQLGQLDLTAAILQAPIAEPSVEPRIIQVSAQPVQSAAIATSGLRILQSTTLRETPGGAVLRVMRNGQSVHATGEQDGEWIEVIDENEDLGWIQHDRVAPSR